VGKSPILIVLLLLSPPCFKQDPRESVAVINEQHDNRHSKQQRWCCSENQIAIDFLIPTTSSLLRPNWDLVKPLFEPLKTHHRHCLCFGLEKASGSRSGLLQPALPIGWFSTGGMSVCNRRGITDPYGSVGVMGEVLDETRCRRRRGSSG
jgi:hypothetical protein